jgi:quinol monooxygenase YgiN
MMHSFERNEMYPVYRSDEEMDSALAWEGAEMTKVDRRRLLAAGLAAVAVPAAAKAPGHAAGSDPDDRRVAVLAELRYAAGTGEAAARALARLADKTRAEPGCLRYIVARDLTDPALFHLSELWSDLGALAAHFETPHLTAFSAAARALGYSAPFLKLVTVSGLSDLNPRELRSSHNRRASPAQENPRP